MNQDVSSPFWTLQALPLTQVDVLVSKCCVNRNTFKGSTGDHLVTSVLNEISPLSYSRSKMAILFKCTYCEVEYPKMVVYIK